MTTPIAADTARANLLEKAVGLHKMIAPYVGRFGAIPTLNNVRDFSRDVGEIWLATERLGLSPLPPHPLNLEAALLATGPADPGATGEHLSPEALKRAVEAIGDDVKGLIALLENENVKRAAKPPIPPASPPPIWRVALPPAAPPPVPSPLPTPAAGNAGTGERMSDLETPETAAAPTTSGGSGSWWWLLPLLIGLAAALCSGAIYLGGRGGNSSSPPAAAVTTEVEAATAEARVAEAAQTTAAGEATAPAGDEPYPCGGAIVFTAQVRAGQANQPVLALPLNGGAVALYLVGESPAVEEGVCRFGDTLLTVADVEAAKRALARRLKGKKFPKGGIRFTGFYPVAGEEDLLVGCDMGDGPPAACWK